MALGLTFVTLPFYFQDVLGRSQVATGLLMTPWPATVALIAPIAGRLADRYPAGILGGIGLSMLSFGLLLLAMLPTEPATARHPVAYDVVRAWLRLFCLPKQPRHRGAAHRASAAAAPAPFNRRPGCWDRRSGRRWSALIFGFAHPSGGTGPTDRNPSRIGVFRGGRGRQLGAAVALRPYSAIGPNRNPGAAEPAAERCQFRLRCPCRPTDPAPGSILGDRGPLLL